LRTLRWDGAPEFGNSFAIADIARTPVCDFTWQTTEKYCPEDNQDIERFNGTCKPMCRAMMIKSALDPMFWSFAHLYSIQIYNTVGHAALNGGTPWIEAYGFPRDVSSFAPFGCRCWVHIPKANRTNTWSVRAVEAVFLGFSTTTNGYVAWDRKNPKKLLDGVSCWFDKSEWGDETDKAEVVTVEDNNNSKFYILRPSARPTAQDMTPDRDLSQLAIKAINFAKQEIASMIEQKRQINVKHIARDFLNSQCSGLVQVQNDKIEKQRSTELASEHHSIESMVNNNGTTNKEDAGLEDRDLPEETLTVPVGSENSMLKADVLQPHQAARGQAGRGIEIRIETTQTGRGKAAKGRKSKAQTVVEWVDCVLGNQVMNPIEGKKSQQNNDSEAERNSRIFHSSRWLLHFADAKGKVFQEEHDLHDLKWKFLPFTPKFWLTHSKLQQTPVPTQDGFSWNQETSPQSILERLGPREKHDEVNVSSTPLPEQKKRVRFDGDEIGNLYHKQEERFGFEPPHVQTTTGRQTEFRDRITNAHISTNDRTIHPAFRQHKRRSQRILNFENPNYLNVAQSPATPKVIRQTGFMLMMAVIFACYVEDICTVPDNAKKVYELPKSLINAFAGEEAVQWKAAYLAERSQLMNLGVYELVDEPESVPRNNKILNSKLIFKVKYLSDGTLDKFKVRLVCTGWGMIYGSQYLETFAPVASITTIRTVIAWAIAVNAFAACLDISGAYCKSDMKEFDIFMRPPKGCEEEIGTNGKPKIWKLKKYLYGNVTAICMQSGTVHACHLICLR